MVIISYWFMCALFVGLTKADIPKVELPSPHLMILSALDVDSTSLANILLKGSPDCQDCLEDVCVDSAPCDINYAVGEWVGTSTTVSILHAFNLGGSDEHFKATNMVHIVQQFLKTNNQFLVVLDARALDSFDEHLDYVLNTFSATFGRNFWSRVVLGTTRWHYDKDSSAERNQTGHNEAWWTEQLNSVIQRRFHLNIQFPTVFIDSDAKLPENIDDPNQAYAFQEETEELLILMRNTPPMDMKTLQEQLDELHKDINSTLTQMQEQIKKLQGDVIDNTIDNDIQRKEISEVIGTVIAVDGKVSDNVLAISENTAVTDIVRAHGFECGNYYYVYDVATVTRPAALMSANYPSRYPGDNGPSSWGCLFSLVPLPGKSVHLEWTYFLLYDFYNHWLKITPDGGDSVTYYVDNVPPTKTYGKDQVVEIWFSTWGVEMSGQSDIYKFRALFSMV